jgi:hypothetical protein
MNSGEKHHAARTFFSPEEGTQTAFAGFDNRHYSLH